MGRREAAAGSRTLDRNISTSAICFPGARLGLGTLASPPHSALIDDKRAAESFRGGGRDGRSLAHAIAWVEDHQVARLEAGSHLGHVGILTSEGYLARLRLAVFDRIDRPVVAQA